MDASTDPAPPPEHTIVLRDERSGEALEIPASDPRGRTIVNAQRRTTIIDAFVLGAGSSEPYVRLSSSGLAAAAPLLALDVAQLAEHIWELETEIAEDWPLELGPFRRKYVALARPRERYADDGTRVPSDADQLFLRFEFEPDLLGWNRPWGIQAVVDAIASAAALIPDTPVEIGSVFEEINYVWCDVPVRSTSASYQELTERYSPVIRELFRVAHTALLASHERSALTEVFAFPEPVRAACEQYLLYFAQFLRDIGIDAETGVKESAGRVLFTVAPTDGAAALARVREALAAYLDLPGNPEFDSMVASTGGVAVQQLQANVLHLRSQVALAQGLLQAKDATIEALQLSNLRLRQLAQPGTPEDGGAAENANPRSEPLVGRYVSVRPVEYKGIAIDLPSLLRSLKRRLR